MLGTILSVNADQLAWGLTWAGLVDVAVLYLGLIRRRAVRRRHAREAHEVGLRSLVRVMLVDAGEDEPPSSTRAGAAQG